jgi:hypothetical protein
MNKEPGHEDVAENPFGYISQASDRIKKTVIKMREQGKRPSRIGTYVERETRYLGSISPHIGKKIHIDTLTLMAGQPDGSIWAGAGNMVATLRGFTVLDNVMVKERAVDGLCMVMEVGELNGSTEKIPNDPILPSGVADQLEGIPILVSVDDSPILEEIPE